MELGKNENLDNKKSLCNIDMFHDMKNTKLRSSRRDIMHFPP